MKIIFTPLPMKNPLLVD